MLKIEEKFCTNNSRYKAAEALKPVGIVLHSIGTPQPKADVLWNFWQNNGSAYVVHYVVDDTKAIHCMPNDRKCWHVGSPCNAKYLGVEMCEPSQIKYTSGAKFTVSDKAAAQAYCKATYQNAVELFASICKNFGWDPMTAIYTHNYITTHKMSNTDHVDPEHLWNGLGLPYTLDGFRKDVKAAMGGSAAAPQPQPPSTEPATGEMYRIRKSWSDAKSQIGAYANLDYAKAACKDGYAVFNSAGQQVYPAAAFSPYVVRVTAKSGLNVRKGPGTSYDIQQALSTGGAYTIVEEQNGWGLLKAYQSKRDGWVSLQYTEKV